MKIKTATKKEYKKTIAILKEIVEHADVNGKPHIYINCEDKRSFSNFKHVWNKQPIDVDSLEVGDKLEIVYYVNHWNGKDYNNFTEVKFIERPSLTKKLKENETEADREEEAMANALADELWGNNK